METRSIISKIDSLNEWIERHGTYGILNLDKKYDVKRENSGAPTLIL
jgi:hypothetical protein